MLLLDDSPIRIERQTSAKQGGADEALVEEYEPDPSPDDKIADPELMAAIQQSMVEEPSPPIRMPTCVLHWLLL